MYHLSDKFVHLSTRLHPFQDHNTLESYAASQPISTPTDQMQACSDSH